jgi:hypothetical protein
MEASTIFVISTDFAKLRKLAGVEVGVKDWIHS